MFGVYLRNSDALATDQISGSVPRLNIHSLGKLVISEMLIKRSPTYVEGHKICWKEEVLQTEINTTYKDS
jgi:hypothetical protein